MDQVRQSDASGSGTTMATESSIPLDAQQLQRIRRIGKTHAACGELPDFAGRSGKSSLTANVRWNRSKRNFLKASHCPASRYMCRTRVQIVSWQRTGKWSARHTSVFFASYPIRNADNGVIRQRQINRLHTACFERRRKEQSMSDLAVLVEREFQLGATNASRMELMKRNWNLRRESMIDPLVGTWNRTAHHAPAETGNRAMPEG